MKYILSILLLILSSCGPLPKEVRQYLRNKPLPVFYKLHNKTEKIKIGVIDSNPLLITEELKPYLSSISLSDPSNKDNKPGKVYHGDAVVKTIAHYFKKNNISNIEIIYCEISSKNYDMTFCFEQMSKLNIFALNISFEIRNLSKNEATLYESILKSSIQVFVAGGNIGTNDLCFFDYKNNFCIAGEDDPNMGSTPIYSGITNIDNFCGEENISFSSGSEISSKVFCGSSYSSPVFLSKAITYNLIHSTDILVAMK